MTQQDKREQFRYNLDRAVMNAHKYGMSWKHLHEMLSDQTDECWKRYNATLLLFKENLK